MSRYHRLDGWRGYSIPDRAVAGSSDTGMWSDSPAPSDKVLAELAKLRAELKAAGIKSRVSHTLSSNAFMIKRWVVVPRADFDRALKLAQEYLEAHRSETRYVHDAT